MGWSSDSEHELQSGMDWASKRGSRGFRLGAVAVPIIPRRAESLLSGATGGWPLRGTRPPSGDVLEVADDDRKHFEGVAVLVIKGVVPRPAVEDRRRPERRVREGDQIIAGTWSSRRRRR